MTAIFNVSDNSKVEATKQNDQPTNKINNNLDDIDNLLNCRKRSLNEFKSAEVEDEGSATFPNMLKKRRPIRNIFDREASRKE